MFRFVVRRLRWLAHVPGAPQCFDTALLVWTALFNRSRLAAMEAIETAALQRSGSMLCVHRFGGVEFRLGNRELGHIHGNGLLDVCVGRKNRDALVALRRAEPHHVLPDSGWVSFWIQSPTDVAVALELLALAAER